MVDVLPAGAVFAGYRIVRPLGRGGMGVVYEAVDDRLGRSVALKIVAADISHDGDFLARFRREAQAGAKVSHPNVAVVHQAGEAHGRPFLAIELLSGGSLRDRIKKEGALPWREAATLGAGVARGLGAIHAKGLVHRDVKPDNVLLDDQGTPKLTDFGLVRSTSRSSLTAAGLTGAGDILGTLEYVAPEQVDDASKVDGRADLYSLGATLYALVTGKPPFQGQGYALITKHLREKPTPSSAVVADVPPALDALILRLLEKRPARRPETGEEVARELEAILAGKTGERSRAKPTAIAVGLIAALVALAVAIARNHPPTPTATAKGPARSNDPEKPRDVDRSAPIDAIVVWKNRLDVASARGKYAGRNGLDVARTDDAILLASITDDGWILTWKADAAGKLSEPKALAHVADADLPVFVTKGRRLVVLSRATGELVVLDVATGAVTKRIGGQKLVDLARGDGDRLVAVSPTGEKRTPCALVKIDVERGVRVDAPAAQKYRVHGFATDGPTGDIAIGAEGTLLTIPAAKVSSVDSSDWSYAEKGATFTAAAVEGDSVAGGSDDGRVWLASRRDRAPRAIVRAHSPFATVTRLVFAGKGRVVSGADDGTLAVVDRAGATPFAGHVGAITGLRYFEGLVFSASVDGTIHCWNIDRKTLSSSPSRPASASIVSLAARGDDVFAACADGAIRMWAPSAQDARELFHASPGDGPPTSLAITSDGAQLAIGYLTGAILVDVRTGAKVGPPLFQWNARAVACPASGLFAICGPSRENASHVNAVGTATSGFSREQAGLLDALVFTPANDGVIVGGRTEKNVLSLWGLADAPVNGIDPTPRAYFQHADDRVRALAILGGKVLLAATDRHGVQAWPLARRDGEPLPPLENEPDSCRALGASPDGKLVAAGYGDGSVALLELRGETLAMRPPLQLVPWDDRATALAFSRDGQTLWIGTSHGVILGVPTPERPR